jgi:hypothetical protein
MLPCLCAGVPSPFFHTSVILHHVNLLHATFQSLLCATFEAYKTAKDVTKFIFGHKGVTFVQGTQDGIELRTVWSKGKPLCSKVHKMSCQNKIQNHY